MTGQNAAIFLTLVTQFTSDFFKLLSGFLGGRGHRRSHFLMMHGKQKATERGTGDVQPQMTGSVHPDIYSYGSQT